MLLYYIFMKFLSFFIVLITGTFVHALENSKTLGDGFSSCAGTYMFAQEIYKNANNDERVKIFQDLSSQYLSAAEASYFLLKDESISPRKIAENNMQKTFNMWNPRFKQLMTEEGRQDKAANNTLLKDLLEDIKLCAIIDKSGKKLLNDYNNYLSKN